VRATVGITADRRAEEQALLLTRAGLDVVLGAALGTVMTTDDGPLRSVTAELIRRPPAYLVADTGIGIRSWVEAARTWGVADDLLGALAAARIAARGPKASGALRSAGLDVWWRAPNEQLAAVIEHVCAQPLAGQRVALQLHGEDEPASIAALQGAGAEVVIVPVYRWTAPADAEPALRLIELTCDGEVAALTFTSAPAVRNLVALARSAGRDGAFLAAVNDHVLVVCIGPVCAEAARAEGFSDPVYPEHWRLGSLVKLVAERLGASTPGSDADQWATSPPSATST
jgi:uroporphyrinogen-III synthase